jgi:hypothetical protein
MTTAPADLIIASDLLDSGQCSPQCLLARELEGTCTCRCSGEFHAALVNAEVPALPPWWDHLYAWSDDDKPHPARRGRFAPGVDDRTCPVLCSPAVFRDAWNGAWSQGAFAYVRPWRGGWAVHCENVQLAPLDATGVTVQAALLGGLLGMARCAAISPGSYASVYGVRDRAEAQAIGHLLHQIAWETYHLDVLPALRAIDARSGGQPALRDAILMIENSMIENLRQDDERPEVMAR